MVSNPGREKAPGTRQRLRAVKDPISWSDVDADHIRWFIAQCTDDGSAVIFGRTRDMGSLSICVLAGDTKDKEYFSNPKEALVVLDDMLDEYGYLTYPEQKV